MSSFGRLTRLFPANAGTRGNRHGVRRSQHNGTRDPLRLAATINGTADFVNGYSYDELSRLIDITQQGQGGNPVAPKQVYYTLDALGNVTGIDRSNSTQIGPDQTGPGYSTLTYNPQGLLTGIDHLHAGTSLESMAWSYDGLDRVSTFTSNDGTATYGYDSVNEVTSAIYSTAAGGHQPTDESYSFDDNGNRTTVNGVTTSVSVNNEVTNDGTFTYTFDAEGNRLTRERDVLSPPANDDLVSYTWDARNRLTGVEDFSWNAASSSWVETESIAYTYDVFDDLIQRVDDVIGSGTTTTQYVWDQIFPLPPGEGQGEGGVNQKEGGIVLAFTNGSLSSRDLNGPNTSAYDQYFSTLAEENVGTGTTTWDLLDDQGSVRDVIDSNGNVLDHLNYNSFGQVAYESAPTVAHIDGYAGGLYDRSTQLAYFIHRWYDPAATVWLSADPLGFAAGDTNLTRYADNDAANLIDPGGLCELEIVVQTFIPAKTVTSPTGTFAGDDRDYFDRTPGKEDNDYRTRIHVSYDPTTGISQETDAGVSRRFDDDGVVEAEAKEGEGMKHIVRQWTTCNGTYVRIEGVGMNPLSRLGNASLGPSIDFGFTLQWNPEYNVLRVVSGRHDGFPAYEIFARTCGGDWERVYATMPKGSPLALFGRGDVSVRNQPGVTLKPGDDDDND